MQARVTKVNSLIFVSISKRRASWQERRKIQLGICLKSNYSIFLINFLQPFEDPEATFIRSVTYRSSDGHRFDNLVKQINDLKKEANKREQQKKEMADVVEQGNLVEVKGRRPIKMSDAFVRPALDGKRLPGEVEIHQNGIRYQSMGPHKVGKCERLAWYQWAKKHWILFVDVLFSNIKHLFFQPCDHELMVILHLHLKAPIIIGKKKTSVGCPILDLVPILTHSIGCSILQGGYWCPIWRNWEP